MNKNPNIVKGTETAVSMDTNTLPSGARSDQFHFPRSLIKQNTAKQIVIYSRIKPPSSGVMLS